MPEKNEFDQVGLLLKVLRFASEKHRHQRRKDKERSPYINHPIDVAERIWNRGGYHEVNAVCAALLHDTVEDTDATFEEIEGLFGKEITDIVREVTDDKSLPKASRKQAQIDHGPHLSTGARHIKLGDKTSNVTDVCRSTPPDWSEERCNEYLDWTKRMIDTISGTNIQMEKDYLDILAEAKAKIKNVTPSP
jgi:guanosine-3',5'-bis(diphosphate) 3'-pyrophosphohydrolase